VLNYTAEQAYLPFVGKYLLFQPHFKPHDVLIISFVPNN